MATTTVIRTIATKAIATIDDGIIIRRFVILPVKDMYIYVQPLIENSLFTLFCSELSIDRLINDSASATREECYCVSVGGIRL